MLKTLHSVYPDNYMHTFILQVRGEANQFAINLIYMLHDFCTEKMSAIMSR